MIPDPQNPDARIDHVLNALRTTEAPAGLEQRVAQRVAASGAQHLAQANEARPAATSFFAVILNAVTDPCISLAKARPFPIAAALTLLLTITTITLFHHRKPTATAHLNPNLSQPYASAQRSANTQVPQDFSLRSHSALANTHAPQAISLASHHASQNSAASTPPPADPDAIALAETLAPSRPASPTPLTQQERLMLAVLHSGNQQGIAALDPVKRDALLAENDLAFKNFFAPPTPAPKTGDKE